MKPISSTHKRIFEISRKLSLTHLGSCITAVDIIDGIYEKMAAEDIFVLSSGHAGLAWYVVLEKYLGHNAEALFLRHGVHPNRDPDFGISASSGSLGHGIGIATGISLAYPDRHIHVLISDGECAEGSVWETLAFIQKHNLQNITIHANLNGYSAYDTVDRFDLDNKLRLFCKRVQTYHSEFGYYFLEGVDAHYCQVPDTLKL